MKARTVFRELPPAAHCLASLAYSLLTVGMRRCISSPIGRPILLCSGTSYDSVPVSKLMRSSRGSGASQVRIQSVVPARCAAAHRA